MYIALVLVNVLLLTSGQTLWKLSVRDLDSYNIASIINVIISPYFILGGLLYVVATGIWIYLLSKLPLSTLYPMQSLAYVLGLIVGYFIFEEFISIQKIIGVIVILVGVFLVAK